MLRLWRIGFLVLTAPITWAQIDEHAVERELKGKPMALRSYSAEAASRYQWTGEKLVAAPSHLLTLGVFTTTSVHLKDGRLIFEGERGTLLNDAANHRLAKIGDDPMRLEIDMSNAPSALTVSALKDVLFFENPTAAIAGLPAPLSEMLPMDPSGMLKTKCNCQRYFDGGQWIEMAGHDPQFTNAKLKSMNSPKQIAAGEEISQKRISVASRVVAYVDSTGAVEDVWLGLPMGLGLDELVMESIRLYVFEPARYKNNPVGSEVLLETKNSRKLGLGG
jgi:hypothetical protein